MDKKEKSKILQQLNEERLRKEVLIPLFQKMGFKDVIEYHGTVEKGKDIIFYEIDKFGTKIYTGVVLKTESISGSVSESSGAMTILNQIIQNFKAPYTDVYNLKKLVIDRCIVITSRDIKGTAIESINGTLESSNLDKLVTFFDGSKLVDLIDTHMPDYFFKEFEAFTAYFNAMKEDFETIRDVSAIGQKEAVQLENIYVSLKVCEKSEQGVDMDMPMDADEDLKIFEGTETDRKRETVARKARVLDANAAVKNYQRLVVVGAPGAGKTTLLKHIALKACKENIEKKERLIVPVPITLREFSQSSKKLREYINDVFEKYRFPEAKDFVEKDLERGRCLLLLDGFDELAARENQEKVTKEIHAFIEKYYGCRVLVTSRVASYHDELSGFTRLELMEFDSDQVKKFIHNWFGEKDRKKAQSMLKAVTENESIKNLAKNPLMIAIIAIIYEEDRELPQRRAALYQRAVEVLLSKWDVPKKLKNRFPVEKKEFILRKLALENHCLNRRTMSEKAILEMINRYSFQIDLKKEEAKAFLEEIWQRSYILRQIAMDTYDFLHLSFQEYFTALELKGQEDGIGTIISHLPESWWEEPILLYAGISKDAAPLIKKIQNEVPEDIFYSNLMLSGKCIADAEFTESTLKKEIINSLWSLHQFGEFPLLKKRAMEVLSLVKPRNIIDSLISQLTTKDVFDRGRAAEALGAIGSAEAIPQLLKAFTTDKNSYVQGRAAEALGAIGSVEAIPQLLKALTIKKKSYVLWRATKALGDIGSAEAVSQLIQALTINIDSEVRWRAADALGAIGSVEAIPQLLEAFITDKSNSVQGRAAYALGAIGTSEAIPQLIHLLTTDKDSSVRGRAAEALGAIGSAEAIPQLIQLLTTDKEGSVRGSAAYALGAIGRVEVIPQLIKSLITDKDSSVRGRAAKALGPIGSAEVIPQLIKALTTDRSNSVRGNAAYALGAIGSAEVIPQLIKALITDKDSYVRGCAAEALGKIGNDTVIQPLKRTLDDYGYYTTEKTVKDKAFEALEKISKRLQVRITRD